MKSYITLLLLGLFVSSEGFTQSCDISRGISRIDSLNAVGSFKSALDTTTSLLDCKEISLPERAGLYAWKYRLYRNQLKTRKAGQAIDSAFVLLRKNNINPSIELQLLRAESFALRGRSDEVEPILSGFETVQESYFHSTYLSGRLSLIRHYAMDGNNLAAERTALLYEALEAFESIDSSIADTVETYYLGNTYRALGNLNRSSGDFEKSASFYQRELDLYRKHYPEDHFNISICNYNLGGVYYEELEYEKALDHFLAAHSIWKEVYKSDSFRMRTLNEAIGDMYWELGEYDLALKYFNASIDNQEAVNNDLSEYTLNSADSLFDDGNYAAALKYYREAVKWREEVYGRDHQLTGACKNFEGRALRSAGDLAGALDAYQRAINILVEEMDDASWYANPDTAMSVKSPQYLLEALASKASLLKQLSLNNDNIDDLQASLDTFECAIMVLDDLKNRQSSERSKTFWLKKTLPLIEEAIETAYLLHLKTGNDSVLNKAFEFSERAKAMLLLSALYSREINSFSSVPPEVTKKEKELKDAIVEYEGRLEGEQKRCADVRDKVLKLYTDKLDNLRREYDAFLAQVSIDYPKYYDLKFGLKIAPFELIKEALLEEKTLLISYFMGIQHIYVFSISQDMVSLRRIPNPDETEQSVISLFNNITDIDKLIAEPQESYSQFITDGKLLYDRLLSNEFEAANYEKLVIIPDGVLAYVPFEVLLTGNTDSSKRDYRNLPYLLREAAISYSPSASVAVLATKSTVRASSYYGFAPDYSNNNVGTDRKSLSALKYNADEVSYGAELFNGKKWIGDTVTEDLLKSISGEASILHLAMHGEVEDEHPLLSRLYFNPSEESDGQLHIYEVYSLDLPSQLALLSACSTASGMFKRGEGILSLERAFQFAGSNSLMATLWKVDDAASASIMQLFLDALKNGQTKDEALRYAKLKYLQEANPEGLHPFYWASFKLSGATSPIEINSFKIRYLIYTGLILLLVILYLIVRKRW